MVVLVFPVLEFRLVSFLFFCLFRFLRFFLSFFLSLENFIVSVNEMSK